MNYLTADFGSTYTKITLIDASALGRVVGTATAFTTIETNVMDGFNKALENLRAKIGEFSYDRLLCCSSAAGGLKMVALGLVPELTAKAAKMAASSAGAKVVKTYSFEISKAEEQEIFDINPDLVLLCGGTDGGNKDVIIANARRLCGIKRNFSVIVAGNKSAYDELQEIFSHSDKNYVITQNVMPEFNKLNIEPAKQQIKDLFISRIIEAKGLSEVQSMCYGEIIPTPLAVMTGCELLSRGTKHENGIGDLMAVDLGGATTDVYSMADGKPVMDNVTLKGLPEPYAKRTVEGDLGMRYSLPSLVEEIADMEQFSSDLGVEEAVAREWISLCLKEPNTLAEKSTPQQRIEEGLARQAIRSAIERHCGVYQEAYTMCGLVYTLTGKDLQEVPYVVGIGGAIINSQNPAFILSGAKPSKTDKALFAKPKDPKYLLDKQYIFASMGLLSSVDKDMALRIMKQEITKVE